MSNKVQLMISVIFIYANTCYCYNMHRLYQQDSKQNVYDNFNNFDDSINLIRRVRQFDWDSVSSSAAQNFNGANTNNRDGFVFLDDDDNKSNFVRNGGQNNNNNNNWFNNGGNNANNYFDDLNNGFRNDDSVLDVTGRPQGTTVAIPGMGTTRSPCEDRCQTTPQYNPVCGSDDMTYFSIYRLQCAQKCGKRVTLKNMGACSLRPPRG